MLPWESERIRAMETRTYNVYRYDELSDESKKRAIQKWQEIYEDFEKIYQHICKKLEEAGYADIEHQLSEDTIIDQMADCWFREDGTIDS